MNPKLVQWTPNKSRALLIFIAGACLFLFTPFASPIILAFFFASAAEPLLTTISGRSGWSRKKSAYALIGAFLLLILLLAAFVTTSVYSQISDVVTSPDGLQQFSGKINELKQGVLNWLNHQSYLSSYNVQARFDAGVTWASENAKTFLLVFGRNIVSKAPFILLSILIFSAVFSVFLLIRPRMMATGARLLGVEGQAVVHIRQFEKICGLAVGSVLIVGFVQAICACLGGALAGVGNLGLLFVITAILALVPVLGAGSVPLAIGLFSLAEGDTRAFVIMLITTIIAGSIDNVMRAWLFSRAAESNPVLSLICLLGAVSLMGFPGLFIAPVLQQLAMIYCFSEDRSAAAGAEQTA